MKNYLKVVIVAVIALAVSACTTMDTQERRMATGAMVGAATGYVISDGDKTATIGGAALGGLAGHQYDKHQQRQDMQRDRERRRRGDFDHYGYGYRK
ncbi:MAG: YMGG-like glycine zipper-containing protein [Moraxella sp.]